MNWVGGSRNRLVMKNDSKKQKEFFEKRKMQQKLKTMGIALPASPGDTSSGSMDLVTLFIVNQIAAKKEKKDPPKVAVFGSSKIGSSKQNKPLVLPMSPCSPSQLSLVDSQPQYSVHGTRKRTQVIPPGFKCRQLSPVLESAFSDNSASDYLPPIADPLTPFSSTSSAPSGQGQTKLVTSGIFPLKLRGQTQLPPHCSAPPWATSGLEQLKFQPFSQPRVMTDNMLWSCGSNPTLYQLETPTAVLFGSPEADVSGAKDRTRHEVNFCLNQPEDMEPMLDFTLNQSETEQQFEEDVFRGFSNEEYEREASPFMSAQSKIYLKDGTPVKSSAPQTVPDTQTMGMELSNCSDINFACPGHNTGPMNGCGYLPNCSCGGGYLSSDSNDDEEYCQPHLQASPSSYMEQVCYTDTPNQGSQGELQQRNCQPRPLTSLIKNKLSFTVDQEVMESVVCPDIALGSNGQQIGSSTAQFASPHPQAETQSPELFKCKKTSSETRHAGTQTADIPTAETRDASTQCSFIADSASKTPEFNLYLPPVAMSVQHPATGRQTDTAAQSNTHTASSGNTRSGGKQTPWSNKKSKAGSISGSSIISKFAANDSDSKVFLQGPINPFLDALSIGDGRGKENEEERVERGQQENGPLMKDLSDDAREEATSATGVHSPSDKAETLQEIADILLLLRQRKEEG
ncbi:uncharacterized protein LOC130163157 isoform X3 [Seriola aureovittata]|uniref:uncharacterized protein LOC130163157 isoform X3 n=1 Tax=Seriola aureovittata TaxID=2871759 RepID=UPI0024BDD42E|nr:uncharacterized protein LOC130163157 isoform X3 [Seriola aureovittata]